PLMRVEHASAHLAEELEPLPEAESVLPAMAIERQSIDVLHGDVRHPFARRPGIEDLGDVLVVHEREGLALLLEPRDEDCGVELGPDQLEGDLAMKRRILLCEIDLPHSSESQ